MEHFALLEWISTFVESLVILAIISTTSVQRIKGLSHYLHMALCAFCLTLLTSFMNSLSVFSFLTPIVAMLLTIPVLSKILSNGSLLIRSTACVVAYFVILTSGYILCAFFALIYGWSENTFSIITAPGMPRAMFLVFDKLINVTFYFLTRRFLPGISTLKRKFQVILLCACAIAYVSVQYLFNIFLHSDIATLQSTLLISWLYIFSFFIILIILFILAARSEQERQTHILLKSTNQLLTENYQKLYTYQQEHAKQIHDFNHHLKTLKSLASMKREHDIIDYIDSLLSVSYQEAMLCHSGSSIVDAIINYKAAEAEQFGISFSFTANIHIPTNIEPVDICGILANQIDNALEACKSMPESFPREIKITIKQVENFAFFRVENTTKCNPFTNNHSLASTKNDTSTQHGLGLKNIRDIANKYNGFLRSEYENGVFISVVSLCFEPLDT